PLLRLGIVAAQAMVFQEGTDDVLASGLGVGRGRGRLGTASRFGGFLAWGRNSDSQQKEEVRGRDPTTQDGERVPGRRSQARLASSGDAHVTFLPEVVFARFRTFSRFDLPSP